MIAPPPAPTTRLLGRDAELALVTEALAGERLITLVGTSGIGKTRLALEAARAAHAAQPGEVGFVDLSETRSVDGARSAVAAALGLPSPRHGAIRQALARRARTLLVLDNFEQHVEAAADTVGAWLAAAPGLTILTTSRERLRLPGEVVIELPPLALPRGDADAEAAAVRLWIEARRRLEPRYVATGAELADVTQIVRELDGLPLAIELCAARVGLMSTHELRARLTRRLELLGHGPRGAPARHASLRGALDGSWEALDAEEQAALAACAVFRGGFSAAAAEAVIGPSSASKARARPALDLLQALRDKSLLRQLDGGRLGMFLAVRDYADEKLTARGDAAPARARHEQHHVTLARALTAAADGPDAASALARLGAERDNLVAAAEHGLGRGAAAAAELAALLVALDVLAWTRGPMDAHVELLERALAATAVAPTAGHARLLELRGLLRANAGERVAGVVDLEAALAELQAWAPDDAAAQARVYMALGWVRLRERKLDACEAAYDAARAAARRAGHRLLEGQIAAASGAVPKELGDYAEAERRYSDGLTLLRAAGARRHEALALTRLVVLYLESGRSGELRAAAEAALALHRELGNHYAEGIVLSALGAASQADGRLGAAREAHERAVSIESQSGDRRLRGACQGYLGVVEFETGEIERAVAHLAAARTDLLAVGEAGSAALFVAFAAIVEAGRGAPRRAREHLEEARALAARAPDERTARVVHLAEALLGEAGAAELAATEADPGPAGCAASIDVRIAARLVGRVLAARDGVNAPLVVHPGGAWFQLGEAPRQDLGRRPAMRLLLVRLAHQRIFRPGAATPAAELVDAGWPGERMSPDSAQNRLHVTLNRLRDLGLRDALLHTPGGYLIDPVWPVRLADPEAE